MFQTDYQITDVCCLKSYDTNDIAPTQYPEE